VKDVERLNGKETASYDFVGAVPKVQSALGMTSPKEAIGRGPGVPKVQLVQVGA